MNKFTFDIIYVIGQQVYHATSESDMGIVTDICYSVNTQLVQYEVAFGRLPDDTVWCTEQELSETKNF